MPIFQQPISHNLVYTRQLLKSTIAVLSQERFSNQRVDEAILNWAIQLLRCYKYDRFDFRDPHVQVDALQRSIDESESSQLRMAMYLVGTELFPNDTQETIAGSLQDEIRRFAQNKDGQCANVLRYFRALLPKLSQ